MYLNQLDVLAMLLAAVVCLICVLQHRYSKRRLLPPGPRGLPLVGNILQIPLENQFKTFTEWGKTYGDLVYASLFQQPLIIVNSVRAAQHLMEKRGAIYSDRPRFVLLDDIFGLRPVTSLLPFGDAWRQQRRWLQDVLQTHNTIHGYRSLQRSGVTKLVARLTTSPELFFTHIGGYATDFSLKVAYGLDELFAEAFIGLAKECMEAIFQSGSLVATLVDFLPFLRYMPSWMPGSGFNRHASNIRLKARQLMNLPFNTVRGNMNSGTYERSFTSTVIEDRFKGQMTAQEEDNVKGAAWTIWIAGAETSSLVLLTFILAMVLHPEVLVKAQKEIDSITGGERLPELEDRENMPYLQHVIMEVYRWNPPFPLGISHRLMQDDIYEDYFIPEGSTVIPNTWAMSRDPSVYYDPDVFRPERYEEMDADAVKAADPRRYVFGFGRRICSGKTLADANFWLGAASILATMDIGKAMDANGNEIEPAVSFISAFTSFPRPFVCSIRPRSMLAARIVAELDASELHA